MDARSDVVEKSIGRFGRYQLWIVILIAIGRLPTEFQLTNVVFLLPSVEYVCLNNNVTNSCPCQNPEYDQSTIVSSVTTTWNLICERRPLASLAQSMIQVGILVGSLAFGFISDRYGRKLAITLALSLEIVTVTVSALVPYFWMYLISRLLIGAGVGGTMLCCYVLLMELSGKSFRPYVSGFIEISYILGYFCLPILAYFLRDWRHLQLATSLPWVFVFGYYWLLPESPRWLITVGRKQEAIAYLQYIANKNSMPIDKIEGYVDKIVDEELKEDEEQKVVTFFNLFKTPKVRAYTFTMAMVWFCCAHSFFGVNQYIGRLQGNLYLNVMVSAACLVPGVVLSVISTVYLNRRTSVIICFCTGAVSLIFIIVVSHQVATLVLAILGQIGMYSAFVQIYLFSSEIFPTVIRNLAMGFASTFARLGAFVAPFVVDIGAEWISVSIFSVLALVAAILCIFLPETKEIELINTIYETENKSQVQANRLRVNLGD